MDWLSSGPGTIVGIFTLVIAVTTTIVSVARTTFVKSTIAILTQSNTALTERVDLLEEENERQKALVLSTTAENTVLRGVVSGSAAVEKLAVLMAEQNERRAQEHSEVMALVTTFQTIVVSNHQETIVAIQGKKPTPRKRTQTGRRT